MEAKTWLIYFLAVVALSLTPGPNSLLVLAYGARYGHRKTLWTVAGGAVGFVMLIAQAMNHPTLIAEVLSPSTAAFDRGSKFAHYRLLDSLQEYVLIDTETPRVEVFRRNAANRWELYPSTGLDASVELASVGWQGTVADLLV